MPRQLRLALLGLAICGTCLIPGRAHADLPPPPPEIGFLRLEVPQPLHLALAGLAISAGVACAGWLLMGKRKSLGRAAWLVAIVSLLLTCGATIWARGQYASHAKQLDQWRSSAGDRVPLLGAPTSIAE